MKKNFILFTSIILNIFGWYIIGRLHSVFPDIARLTAIYYAFLELFLIILIVASKIDKIYYLKEIISK